ncbi:hypothetical protein GQ602_007208 [Ophiocordyceps camponoti-floridani]|uniref:Uncharacterized protein n=1 Tax=Ophiocordyceps camponoti-floridani TaxID=2030778 RepID=A0A8H4VAJ8_9HYPO|nr:hypothetical protein GQ602_007208 [Ophiocordyceps camponoti-floridani]
MASSKSSQTATLFPAFSMSVSSLRLFDAATDKLDRRAVRRDPSFDPVMLPQKTLTEPMSRPRSRSRFWGSRVSSILPPLMSSPADSQPRLLRRKPPPSAPAEVSPVSQHSPVLAHLPSRPPSDASVKTDELDSPSAQTLSSVSLSLHQSPVASSADMPPSFSLSSLENAHTHHTASTTPSPESKPVEPSKRRNSVINSLALADNAPRPGRLQKGLSHIRRRSTSLYQLPLICEPSPDTMPLPSQPAEAAGASPPNPRLR